MLNTRRTRATAALLLAMVLVARHSAAQDLEIMTTFASPDEAPAGRLLATADGSLYGTTLAGGKYARGSIFALRPDGVGGFTYEEIFAFSGHDGAAPVAGLSVGPDGRFYGSTNAGGAGGIGTFFRLDLASHLTQLSAGALTAGALPSSLTLASDGNLYGATTNGGAHNQGIVFRLDLSGSITTLHDLGGPDEGAFSHGGLVQGGDGRLYGTTSAGGAPDNPGTVFAIDTAGNYTTLHRFSGTDGLHPTTALTLGDDGALYGTTTSGGASNYGTVFRITLTGVLTTVHSFAGTTDGSDGASPGDNMVRAPDGHVYGTTPIVGLPKGTIPPTLFRVAAGVFTTLPATGPVSPGPLTIGADGQIYAVNGGGVYRIDPSGAVTTVYAVAISMALAHPYGHLIELPGGSFAGLVHAGVLGSAIFQLTPTGQRSTFHTFAEGVVNDPLLRQDDGDFYGTERATFTSVYGEVFRVDPASVETTLHEFSDLGSDGAWPQAGLTAGPSGELWGTTQNGGAADVGTVFKLDATDTFSTLSSFGSGGNPDSSPSVPLVYSPDGNFYSLGHEDFYRVDAQGSITRLHEFIDQESSFPGSPLMQASDGNFYGSMVPFNAPPSCTLYRMDSAGSLTPLHTFPGDLFATDLIQAADTSIYGTMPGNPFANFPYDYGSIFRMDSANDVTTVFAFDGGFGGLAWPSGPVLEASDGNFYGAAGGGPDGSGGIYRIVSAGQPPSLDSLDPPHGRAAGGAAVTAHGSHFRGAGLSFGGVSGIYSLGPDQATLTWLAPALPPGTLNDVTVTNQDATSATLPGAWFSDFLDVAGDDSFHDYIEKVFRNGITAGCGGGSYCPGAAVTRAQMAVFLLKAEHGSVYTPPPCTGHFGDVGCPSAFADWIEQLAAENITAGCGDGTNYCPGDSVTRQQMAVFLLKTEHGSGYAPPPCAQAFLDVPCPSLFADWIEQLAAEGITGGCGAGNFCPANPNTRGQMAVFLTKTFSLP